MIRYSLTVKGIVQGVGFRPFMYRLAKSLSVFGFVRNTSEGVYAEIEGEETACEEYIASLRARSPVLARIDSVETRPIPLGRDRDFVIIGSLAGEKNTLISPDIGICTECAADISDKNNRRYRYAFTNCTNCGPRFTIIRDIPYDRSNTTMAEFEQCPECRREYEDPENRRFHAQPNACPVCGPKLCFYENGKTVPGDPYKLFDDRIAKGRIVAVKGIGGYHLACDAANGEAVAQLRKNKVRYDKPFAVMMRDLDTVRRFCELDDTEAKALCSPRKPIVLLKKKQGCALAEEIAPGNSRLGIMLPYTPLHCIIMENRDALVMTSANLSERPMIYDDSEALSSVLNFKLADAVLTHNRKIHRRMDDSVSIVTADAVRMIRRARGYAPEPLRLDGGGHVILALGAQQKNTFCLIKGENAFLSGHIGDLDDIDTAKCYEAEIASFERLFEAKPEIIACDMHPDYVSTRYAQRFKDKLPVIQIQHHRAHFASVLAENGVEGDAIGFVFDGTGYGEDNTLWGGEALLGGISRSLRVGHMLCAPLPGGEAAIREPWRMALSVLNVSRGKDAALAFFENYGSRAEVLLRACERGVNSPLTSGAGRLFDAVAAIAGLGEHTTYEGQAAVALEQAIDETASGSYGFDIAEDSDTMIFDWRQLICDAARDADAGTGAGVISARFHRAVVGLIKDAASRAARHYGVKAAVLSGGVFQNSYLLKNGLSVLESLGFHAFSNEKVPSNDGGIAFGQAAIASCSMKSGDFNVSGCAGQNCKQR